MATIFTRIIKGEIPCYKIAEDDNYIAFLDINPLKAGHTLVVPKIETDYLFDIDDDQLSGLIVFSKKVQIFKLPLFGDLNYDPIDLGYTQKYDSSS